MKQQGFLELQRVTLSFVSILSDKQKQNQLNMLKTKIFGVGY